MGFVTQVLSQVQLWKWSSPLALSAHTHHIVRVAFYVTASKKCLLTDNVVPMQLSEKYSNNNAMLCLATQDETLKLQQ